MAIYRLNREIKEEPIAQRLQKAINLGKQEALQEVLKWLEDGTIDHSDEYADPIVAFTIFDNKEQMLQSFKDRFNIE